ncbi:MAG: tRNA (N6-isopentenyl adenosine(37)-C2)-methylthiotransferase MiaB [Anaerolineales bacterium]|nr:tRNA (N6-isopentenyl adenosine(37)-C2)-methylthiotransferase MiaB [Anaerolineales bacterium]
MKYHIWTSGCQMNVADSQRVADSLERLGMQATDEAEQADVVVVNTCVVRQSAEDRAHGRLHALRPLKDRRPDLVINLMGCMVGVKGNPTLQQTFPFVDVFSPPADPKPLLAYLEERLLAANLRRETKERHALMDGEARRPAAGSKGAATAFVTVVEGCSHACTFCVIPYRRGAERSRPASEIVAEVRGLVESGVREITLLGQIVDRYGLDLPEPLSLAALLHQLQAIEGLQRIRFLTSHPNWMTDDLLATVAELPKVCEHIEVPVQAGDDQVLARMRRGYTADDYRRLIERVRKHIPGVAIATDIIVGFPGESEAQFQKTYGLLEELQLDVAHLARYSTRPGTLAARRMQDDVPEPEKMRRFRLLEDLQEQAVAHINTRLLEHVVEVLVEQAQRPGHWRGRTRTNKLVFFDSDLGLAGSLVPVRIEWAGPWSLRGSPAAGAFGLAAGEHSQPPSDQRR